MRSAHIRKHPNSPLHHNQQPVLSFVINDLQQTIDTKEFLPLNSLCSCQMCTDRRITDNQRIDGNIFRSSTKESAQWLKKVLDALCLSGAKSLKLWLPDILFVSGQSLETFQTSRRDGRVMKFSGTTPLKSMFLTMVRLRQEYKTLLQQNFNAKMLQKVDPDRMHLKYFDKLVPSHFHDGMENKNLHDNKYQFKRYILHTNKKYEIQQIEEHKMNHKEPFCLVKYTDGNCQLFNQLEFEVYSLAAPSKLQEQMVFVQSYIKYKLQTEAIYYSDYTLSAQSLNSEIDKRAEREIMILIAGIKQFDEEYIDIEALDELSIELMFEKPREYVELMTYKIVHYLNMTSRVYIDHIKIKWIMNDIGNIYLQEIMEFEMSQIPRRFIKFRLSPKDETLDYYNQSHNFVEIYKEMKRRKAINTAIIKKDIQTKTYKQVLSIIDQEYQFPHSQAQTRQDTSSFQFVRSKKPKIKDVNKTTSRIKGRYSDVRNERKPYEMQTSYTKHLKSQSIDLDKWRNIGLDSKKKSVSSKIYQSFTLQIPIKVDKNTRQSTQSQRKDLSVYKQIIFTNNAYKLKGENHKRLRKQKSCQNSTLIQKQQLRKRLKQRLNISFC